MQRRSTTHVTVVIKSDSKEHMHVADAGHLAPSAAMKSYASHPEKSDTLVILHWLRLPERVNFKQALMAYRMLNGLAPPYLNQLVPVSSLPGRRRLLSSFTLQLHVPPYRLKHSARRRAVCTVCLFLTASAEDILVSPVIS